MGKKKGSIGTIEESAEMDMSPMIDMVFLLLIFFVVNATAITVKRDKNVEMPVASASGEVKSANGFIVVNVWADEVRPVENKPDTLVGRPAGISSDIVYGDDDAKPLADDQRLQDYIEEKAKAFKESGIDEKELRLYLRGDQKALFKHSRKVIALAANAGVVDIVFGVIPPKKN